MEIQNISYKELQTLEGEDMERYVFAIEFGDEFNSPIDTLGAGEIQDFPFGVVKDIQDSDDDSLENIFSICKILIDPNRDILSLYQERAYILNGIKQITEVERQTLSSGTMSNREQNALYDEDGNNLFEGLGSLIQISDLAGGDVTKYEKVRETKWSTCYAELLLRSRRNKFQRNLAKQMK